MSPKCPVPSLSDVSLAIVAKQLVEALHRISKSDDISLPFVLITSYYESLGATTDIYQDLLNLILQSEYLDPALRFYAMKLLLRDNVKSLATGSFPSPYFKKVMDLISDQGESLTALNLKGIWVKDEHLELMYKIIKKLIKLEVLNIPYMANDEILKFIGEQNKVLKLLDVSGDTDITEIGIEAMLNNNQSLVQSLTVVNIGNYGEENVDHTDVALLIRYLPNLTNLGCYSFVGKALKSIHDADNLDANFKTKLQYVHDIRTDRATMKAIVELCPLLETIYLDEPEHGILINIKELNKINQIKLNKFQCHELHQLLDKIGYRLKSLMLLVAKGSFNFTQLAQTCQNLQSLECYQLEIATHEEESIFEKLEHIDVLNANLSTSCLKYLMSCAPSLKKLIIGDEIKMHDGDMMSLLRHHNLHNLESIWFPNAPRLSGDTVEMLVDKLPNLVSIGDLSGWLFTPDEMLLMRAINASTNTNVVLLPLGTWQQI